jgi:putative FmdB family regulatory protein
MPFYEYQCKSCGHELEAMQKVSDALLKKCPHCGKAQLTRLMSAPVFRLKGGGWYETDFKGDKENQRNLADKPEDAPKVCRDYTYRGAREGVDCRQRQAGRQGRR